jgi:integrase
MPEMRRRLNKGDMQMANDLTALEVSRLLKRPVLGRHRVAECVYLQVRGKDKGSWLFRYMLNGKAHWMGLGRCTRVTLAQARERARPHLLMLEDDKDPLEAKRARIIATRIEKAKTKTFGTCAKEYIAEHAASWRSPKHLQQWTSTVEGSNRRPALTAAINDLPISSIDTALALEVLRPIWATVPESATRVRQRAEAILDWAKAQGLRDGDNPFAWRDLKHVLADPVALKAIKTKGSFAALDYRQVPAFMGELRPKEGAAARALEFCILTASRTNEVLDARWPEFDFAAKTWTIPAIRMKAGREHRVPLCERALQILSALPVTEGIVFNIEGQRLNDRAMLEVLRSIRPGGLTVHGFRSAFTDWAHEQTAFPKTVIDMALAHTVGDKTEAAYRRGDLFAKRAELMRVWNEYCVTPTVAGATVTPIRRAVSS